MADPTRPGSNFFDNLRTPKMIQRSTKQVAYGKASLTYKSYYCSYFGQKVK